MFALIAQWIIDIKLFHDNFIFVQDQRWNAEKPSADLDPSMNPNMINQSQTCQLLNI